MQSDSVKTYAYGTNKEIIHRKEKIKCSNMIKQYEEWLVWWCYKRKYRQTYLNWSQSPDHLYGILIIWGSASGKTYALLYLIKQQDDDDYSIIDKIYLYVQDPYEAKYQYLIKKRENNGLKNLKHLKAFIEYPNNMQDVYKNMKE